MSADNLVWVVRDAEGRRMSRVVAEHSLVPDSVSDALRWVAWGSAFERHDSDPAKSVTRFRAEKEAEGWTCAQERLVSAGAVVVDREDLGTIVELLDRLTRPGQVQVSAGDAKKALRLALRLAVLRRALDDAEGGR